MMIWVFNQENENENVSESASDSGWQTWHGIHIYAVLLYNIYVYMGNSQKNEMFGTPNNKYAK